ncbi:hypothetical protein KO465_04400 [Candidatus Micrarchaeota archaeon]|jgi:putative SOS response-associated peptidase YedK|nr:hypothetical protein [Candidatus Micrarchaeota archaeon]
MDWNSIRNELKKSKENAQKPLPEKLRGQITDIVETTAGEVYGEYAKDPDRAVINVRVEVCETGDRFRSAFTLPQGRASWMNPTFKLRQFTAKYGDVPDIGMVVDVCVSNDGRFDIDLS